MAQLTGDYDRIQTDSAFAARGIDATMTNGGTGGGSAGNVARAIAGAPASGLCS